MAKPTVQVQVPVSVIEGAIAILREGTPEQRDMMSNALSNVLGFLSQPTPSAEPWYDKQPRTDEQFVSDLLAESPRIADMAPGTTFYWKRRKWTIMGPGGHARSGRRWVNLDSISPSTIRDVTPPSTESTK